MRQLRVSASCEDGSFVSAAWKTMKRWDEKGTVLQTFSGHSNYINRVIELNRDVIVSAQSKDTTVKMWKVSTGECLRTLTLHSDGSVRTGKGEGWCVCKWVLGQKDSGVG